MFLKNLQLQYNTIVCTIKIFTASVIPRETQALAPLLWGEVLVLEGSLLDLLLDSFFPLAVSLGLFFLQILSEIGFNPGLVCPKSGFYWSPSHRCFVPARLFHLFWLLLGRYMAPLRFSGLSHYPVYYFYFFIICHNKIPFVGIELESRNRLQKFFNAGG